MRIFRNVEKLLVFSDCIELSVCLSDTGHIKFRNSTGAGLGHIIYDTWGRVEN